jgi:hypothetical protein
MCDKKLQYKLPNVLPLPFGVILLRYVSAVMLRYKALMTTQRHLKVKFKPSVRIKPLWRNTC